MNDHVSNYVNLTANIFKYSLSNLRYGKFNNTVSVCMHACLYVSMDVKKRKEKQEKKNLWF